MAQGACAGKPQIYPAGVCITQLTYGYTGGKVLGMRRSYFVRYGAYSNVYKLRWVFDWDRSAIVDLTDRGYERITYLDAVALCKSERWRRETDSAFSGYADISVYPHEGYEEEYCAEYIHLTPYVLGYLGMEEA